MTTDREMRDISPEQMAAIVDRAQVRPGAPAEFGLAPDTAADRKPGLRPRSVKLSDREDLLCKLRAQELGKSQSQYIRDLIKADIERSQRGEVEEMVPLELARRTASQAAKLAVEEAISKLSHGPGHAA